MIWVDIVAVRILPEDCLLSQTTSSTSAGWLRKSNFADNLDEDIQLATARRLATLIIDSQCCIYSQWFSGDENNISDSLSRDFHLSYTHITSLLSTAFPNQVPFGLEILPLPTEISSWATSQLLLLPQTTPWSNCSWRQYRNYLLPIGISNDIFLETFDRGQHHKILCAFAQSIREGRFGSKPPKLLKAESV